MKPKLCLAEDLWRLFGYSHQVQVCGHRQDRKGNETLNARLIEIFGYNHQLSSSIHVATDKTGKAMKN
ncbi:hypothetical protein ACROYT_G009157 [Oculina patagonica]